MNGDQSGTGKSKFTYRPFTLEGNFACAAGIQEMLLQSHNGLIRIFPAIPDSWNDAAFENFRAEGAFTISATRKNGALQFLKINSEKGGYLRILNPFEGRNYVVRGVEFPEKLMKENIIEIEMIPGKQIEFLLQQ